MTLHIEMADAWNELTEQARICAVDGGGAIADLIISILIMVFFAIEMVILLPFFCINAIRAVFL